MKLGFIGIGNMGLPMAEKFLDDGHELTVYDVRAGSMQPLLERQARPAASPREMADQLETVFVSLPTLETLRDVCLGDDGLIQGSTIKTLVNT